MPIDCTSAAAVMLQSAALHAGNARKHRPIFATDSGGVFLTIAALGVSFMLWVLWRFWRDTRR